MQTWISEKPGSYSSSTRAVGPVSSSREKLLEAALVFRSLFRYAFCCFLNCTDSFCSSIASVLCTFCFTCRAWKPVFRPPLDERNTTEAH